MPFKTVTETKYSREELVKEMLKLPQKAMRLLWMEFWQILEKHNPGEARKLLADTMASIYDNKRIETWMEAQLQKKPDIRASHLALQASQQFDIDRKLAPCLRNTAIRVKARTTRRVKSLSH